jgi:hypothetical protein
MTQEAASVRQRAITPRAAAIRGNHFALLLITSHLDFCPFQSHGARTQSLFALNLLPFAGIAFLWFIGVLRDRLGEGEDRFFATVFLGSGVLYISMVFIAAAVAGGILRVLSTGSQDLI